MSPCSGRALVVALVTAMPLSAQGGVSSIPAPLASALIVGGSQGRPAEFTVGVPPAGWPAELTPRSMSTVGGMRSAVTLVAVFADTTRRPVAAYETLLESAGFRRPTPAAGNGFTGGGGAPQYFCRDSASVSARNGAAPAGQSYVHVTYNPRSRMACAAVPQPSMTSASLELPVLTPPPGARVNGSGSGSSSRGEVASHTEITGSTLSPSDLLAHYERQLKSAGWTSTPPATSVDVGAQVFDARDKEGNPWHGLLTVLVSGARRNLSLDMNRARER